MTAHKIVSIYLTTILKIILPLSYIEIFIKKIQEFQDNTESKTLQELYVIIFDVYSEIKFIDIKIIAYYSNRQCDTLKELYEETKGYLFYLMEKQEKKEYEKRLDDIENMIKYHPGGMEYNNAKEDFEKLNKTVDDTNEG